MMVNPVWVYIQSNISNHLPLLIGATLVLYLVISKDNQLKELLETKILKEALIKKRKMQTLRRLQLMAFVVLLVSLYSNDKFMAMAQLYQDVDLEFEADGTTHSETVHVSGGGDHVLYTDIIDGFEVLLIHEKGLVLMKNMTSAECFFAQLGNLPPTTMRGKFRPIYVTTDHESTASINFHKGDLIPDQFLQAALGPRIGSHCLHLPSYWLEKDKENPKDKEKRFFGWVIAASLAITINISW